MLCLLSFKILLRTCLCHFVLGFRWNTLLLYNLGSSGRTDKMPARKERQPNAPVRGFDEQNEILDKDQSEFWDGLGEVSSLFYFWSYIEVMKKPRKANLLNSLFGEEASAFSMWKITFCETYFFLFSSISLLLSNRLTAIVSILYEESSMMLLQKLLITKNSVTA